MRTPGAWQWGWLHRSPTAAMVEESRIETPCDATQACDIRMAANPWCLSRLAGPRGAAKPERGLPLEERERLLLVVALEAEPPGGGAHRVERGIGPSKRDRIQDAHWDGS